jgi:hypothetical protein
MILHSCNHTTAAYWWRRSSIDVLRGNREAWRAHGLVDELTDLLVCQVCDSLRFAVSLIALRYGIFTGRKSSFAVVCIIFIGKRNNVKIHMYKSTDNESICSPVNFPEPPFPWIRYACVDTEGIIKP